MSTFIRAALVAALALAVAAPLAAQDQAQGKGKPQAKVPGLNLPKDIALTDEQRAKIDELHKEYAPKRAALQEQHGIELSPEQKQARQEALAAAKAAGATDKEAARKAQAAVQLTDEQKQQSAALKEKHRALNEEIRGRLFGILTDEQGAQLKSQKKGEPRKQPAKQPGKLRAKEPGKQPAKEPVKQQLKEPSKQPEKQPVKSK